MTMHDPFNTRRPAPELTPDQYLTVLEFEQCGTDTFGEANRG